MESFATEIIAITDNLKEAFTELSIGIVERDNLLRLAHKLDLIEEEMRPIHKALDAEQEELSSLKKTLLPLKGFFVDENVKGNTNTDRDRSSVLLKQKNGYKRPLTSSASDSDSTKNTSISKTTQNKANLDTIDHITDSEFDALPKYSKGRLNAEKLNHLIDDFNKIVADKYTLLSANPAKLSLDQRQRFYDWKQSETEETRGKFFVSEADLKSKSGQMGSFKFDQSVRNMLTVLRQAGRIKEVRSTGTIRYVITSASKDTMKS